MDNQGAKVDARIKSAIQKFEGRISDLKRSVVSDASQITNTFLNTFQDGDVHRAEEIVSLSVEIASLIREFNGRATSMSIAVAGMLLGKDLVAYSAENRLAHEKMALGLAAISELPAIFSMLDELRAGRDPGPTPQFTLPRKIEELEKELSSISYESYDAGNDVAATIEMMADNIELRIEYLHEFKLSNLPLNPAETLERIRRRFEDQPQSVARRAALELLKATVVAVVTPIVESHLPWSVIVNMFERMQIALVGERLQTVPGTADALFFLKRDLTQQREALELLFSDCERLEKELHALSLSLLDVPPIGTSRH